MKSYRITGGPAPVDVRIYDPDGKDITEHVLSFEISARPDKLTKVVLTSFASMDLNAVDEDVPVNVGD